MPVVSYVRVFVPFVISLFFATSALARSEQPPFAVALPAPELTSTSYFGTRDDTLYLFAASGPGSYGSPGTDSRGFTFDHEGGPAAAGWFGVDLSSQAGQWWHLADTDLCAGTGTDMSQALPFDAGDPVNDHALWCGRAAVCNWESPDGYGANWEQYAIVDLDAYPVSAELVVDFAYRSDFEGDNFDWFEVRVDSAGVWKTVHVENTSGDQTFRELSITVPAADFGGGATRIGFYFSSDDVWSDEDGRYDSDLGAVWIDNITARVDGVQVFAADFEDNIEPAELSFETPPGAGDFTELRQGVFQEDICIQNDSYLWTFFDPATTDPDYPAGIIPFGPPYVNMDLEGPDLELDQHGTAMEFNPGDQLRISRWVYEDLPQDDLVYFRPPAVAAQIDEGACLGRFVSSSTFFFGSDLPGWRERTHNVTEFLVESAMGREISGVKVRIGGVIDMCAIWCDLYGSGEQHSPGPYYDTFRIYMTRAVQANWTISPFTRLQDSFPGPGGTVRIDGANDLQPNDSSTLVVSDSTVVGLDMIPGGGVALSYNADAGEERPELRLWWRIVDGPHMGIVEAAQADPDDTDGIWSPWTGSQPLHGDTWGTMQADSARNRGSTRAGKYAFDFDDDYFEAGDIIEFFYRAVAVDGTVSAYPQWALSNDETLRNYLRLRCLPSAGTRLLYVEDADGPGDAWQRAFRYNHCGEFDIYKTQSPSSGLNNGLGCRATSEHLSGYHAIIWDSGDRQKYTLNVPGNGQICDDSSLLETWLDQSDHDVGLWVMGNTVASDLHGVGTAFLNQVLGAQREQANWDYYDATGIRVPRVLASHPDLEWLGGTPSFWVAAGCPDVGNLDLISPIGSFAEATHDWEVDPGYGAVAGVLNRDPDGDGSETNSAGYASVSIFNPFGYELVRDDGYGLPVAAGYPWRMVEHILSRLLNYDPCYVPAETAPQVTGLAGAYPNPFNPSTKIRFNLAEAGKVELNIYDLSGRRVRTLLDGPMDVGTHELDWQGRDDAGHELASGVYFLRFSAGELRGSSKLTLLK